MTKRKWHKGPPPSVGWWPASVARRAICLRWWDGFAWSTVAAPHQTAISAARCANWYAAENSQKHIEWTDRPDDWPERSKT